MSQGTGSSGSDPYQTVAQMVPGQVIMDRYSLRKVLGRGGFGVVWLARDEQLEMDVAIKFLTDLIVSNPEAVEDLKRETRYSLRLTHPNIVRIYGFIQGSMVAGVSMEYVDGGSMSALKVRQPKRCFTAEAMAPIVEKLCDALQYAHTKVKIAHRDLKPGNLMLDSTGDLKVADFGISRSISDTHTALTRAVSTSGTPAFMSPQQMMGQPARVTDDIYSLGATFFDLLAGKPPFFTGDVASQVAKAEPPTIQQRREELGIDEVPVPPEWEATLRACLAKDENDRPQSAADVAQRLGLRVPVASMYVSDGGATATGAIPLDDSGAETPPDARIATPRSLSAISERSVRPARSSRPLKIWLPVGGVAVAAAAAFLVWQGMGGGSESGATGSGAATASNVATEPRDATPETGADPPSPATSTDTGSASGVPGETIQAETITPEDPASSTDPAPDPAASTSNPSTGRPASAGTDSPRSQPTAPPASPSRPPQTTQTPVTEAPSPAMALSEARSALARGSLTEAQRKIDEARSIAPGDPQIASLQRAVDDAEQAQDTARRISALETSIPAALSSGDLERATTGLEQLARLNSNHPSLSGWRSRVSEIESAARQAQVAEESAGDETVILALIDSYRRAMEAVDIDQFARLWVALPGERKNRYKSAFDSMTRQSLALGSPSIRVDGTQAEVSFSQKTTSHLKAGSPVQNETQVRLQLEKAANGWKIRDMTTGG